jgi:hypothetical protein
MDVCGNQHSENVEIKNEFPGADTLTRESRAADVIRAAAASFGSILKY